MALAAPRAVLVDKHHGRLDQPLGQLTRVADGGGGQDELGRGAVETGDALEPPQHVGDVRAEHPAIGVHFVDDHEAQAPEELLPAGVMRQDAGMKHVWIGKHDAGISPDRRAVPGGCVAVINRRLQIED